MASDIHISTVQPFDRSEMSRAQYIWRTYAMHDLDHGYQIQTEGYVPFKYTNAPSLIYASRYHSFIPHTIYNNDAPHVDPAVLSLEHPSYLYYSNTGWAGDGVIKRLSPSNSISMSLVKGWLFYQVREETWDDITSCKAN